MGYKNNEFQQEYLSKTDEELVAMTLKDPNVFLYLMKRYEKMLIAYIRRISGFSIEDAEDVLQDTFIKTYLHLNSFDNKLKFSSWIYRITRNETINAYKKRQVRPQVIVNIDDSIINNLASDFRTDKEVDEKMLKNHLILVLNQLDNKYKEILVLRFWEDKSYEEISDILQKPIGTVATLINRAKKKFQQELGKYNLE